MGVWGWDEIQDNVELYGVVEEISNVADDGDWCFKVKPDPGSADLLTNPSGYTNGNGWIECEIEPPDDLLGQNAEDNAVLHRYLDGMKSKHVIVKGTWVRDRSHSWDDHDIGAFDDGDRGKTEIHPITSIQIDHGFTAPDTVRFEFFAFSDDSMGVPAAVPHSGESRLATFDQDVTADANFAVSGEVNMSPQRSWTIVAVNGGHALQGRVWTGEPGSGHGFYRALVDVTVPRHWATVGGPADAIIAGGWGMIALQPATRVPFHYLGTPGHWQQVGAPAAQFAITDDALFGLAGDREKIWQYSGSAQSWVQVGDSADAIVAGGWGMIALQRGTGVPFHYLGTPGHWQQVGAPAAQFAITDDALFGLAGDREKIWQYSGSAQSWVQVGDSADAIVAGGWGMIALQRGTGVPFHYLGTPGHWEQVGAPAAQFAITDDGLFGLAGDRQKIWMYSGQGLAWKPAGGPAQSLAAGGRALYALAPGKASVMAY